MAAQRLSLEAIHEALQHLPGWSLSRDGLAIERDFVFGNFVQAFGFMTQMALRSETLDHHPEWVNVYNRVRVRLTTHDAGGLTPLDLQWAQAAAEVVHDTRA